MWTLDTEKVDLGFVNPPVGRNRFKITDMKLAKTKDGKSEYIQTSLSAGKAVYSLPFFVMADDETQARIANQNVAKLGIAVGVTGVLKPERLKSFINKFVEIEFKASKDGRYVNFANAYPVEDKKEESELDSDEPEEEEGKKKAPWEK